MKTFEAAVEDYRAVQGQAVAADAKFRMEHAKATLAADGKNAEQRAAQADLATIDLRVALERAKLDERCSRALLDYMIAKAHGGQP